MLAWLALMRTPRALAGLGAVVLLVGVYSIGHMRGSASSEVDCARAETAKVERQASAQLEMVTVQARRNTETLSRETTIVAETVQQTEAVKHEIRAITDNDVRMCSDARCLRHFNAAVSLYAIAAGTSYSRGVTAGTAADAPGGGY